jgi:hypothetical protein
MRAALRGSGQPLGALNLDLVMVLGHGMRLRALLALLAEQVLRKDEKAVVWCSYPVMQKMMVSMLTCLGFRARAFLSSLGAAQRTALVRKFNAPDDRDVPVLVCNYACSSAGYNMQKANRNVHLFDPAPCESAKLQAIGRTHPLGSARWSTWCSTARRARNLVGILYCHKVALSSHSFGAADNLDYQKRYINTVFLCIPKATLRSISMYNSPPIFVEMIIACA